MLTAVPIVLAALFAATPASEGIERYCVGDARCVAAQQMALKHFLGVWVMFDAAESVAEGCMRGAKARGAVDWVAAERCIKVWAKGRPRRSMK